MINKNDEFEIEITDFSDDGAGIGKTDGFTWFVKDAVIGDRVKAAATKVKKNYGFARLVDVITPSSNRTTPQCTIAKQCGGCQLQQLDYKAQLHFKEDKVRNDIVRIGGFTQSEVDSIFEPIIGMEMPLRYRNKAIYPIGLSRDGRIVAGFYAGRTHNIIECSDCLLGYDDNKYILDIILEFMDKHDIKPYDEISHTGIVRHVLIRKGFYTDELMICIIVNADRFRYAEALCSELKAACPELKSFSVNVNKARTNVIMGEKLINIYGPGYIEDIIHEPDGDNEVRFKISPYSFFQVNSLQTERLYGTALEFADLNGAERVWDLYCGVGTISLFLARHAAKVYGVEIVPAAIDNARENATANHIDNAEFFVGKAEEILPEWYENEYSKAHKSIDVIVVDPPRKGCDEHCLRTMTDIAPKRIVYVSCDPATLSRDLKYLCQNGYRLERVRPVDMFPQTVHVETVCLLVRRNSLHIDIDVDVEEILQEKRGQATYAQIKDYVLEQNGLKVSSLCLDCPDIIKL